MRSSKRSREAEKEEEIAVSMNVPSYQFWYLFKCCPDSLNLIEKHWNIDDFTPEMRKRFFQRFLFFSFSFFSSVVWTFFFHTFTPSDESEMIRWRHNFRSNWNKKIFVSFRFFFSISRSHAKLSAISIENNEMKHFCGLTSIFIGKICSHCSLSMKNCKTFFEARRKNCSIKKPIKL